jgi:hypothetical protein
MSPATAACQLMKKKLGDLADSSAPVAGLLACIMARSHSSPCVGASSWRERSVVMNLKFRNYVSLSLVVVWVRPVKTGLSNPAPLKGVAGLPHSPPSDQRPKGPFLI